MKKAILLTILLISAAVYARHGLTPKHYSLSSLSNPATKNFAKPRSIPVPPAGKMNVVLFVVDDLGWADVSVNGSEVYETPNIEKLAKEGVSFKQAYSTCHVCSPSRSSILTGKYPARLKLTDWLTGRKDYPFQKLKNVETIQSLPLQEETLAEALKSSGYKTAIYGKWHLGEEDSSPLKHGFDERITEWNKGWPAVSYFSPYQMKGLEGGPDGEYLTDRLTSEATKYIEHNKDQPFFLYLPHFAVHDPIEGRPDLVKKYQKKLAERGPFKGPAYILEENPDTTVTHSRSELNALLNDERYKGFSGLPGRMVKIKQFQDNVQFAAMVESMDESLGKIMAKLKELKIEDKTIIIFVSDNGGMSAANFGKPDKVINPKALDKTFSTSNLPLRGGKGWFYEGGIRVPMIVKWPGQGKQGLVSQTPVIGTDIYPTILDMLGLKLRPEQHKDGKSIASLVKGGQTLDRKAIYWHFPHYSNHGLQSPGGAVRSGDYKLLEYFENHTVQLFNLKNDPGEQNDISKSQPAKVTELKTLLHNWQKEVGAKMMEKNPDYISSTKP
jgi:arylsulfatase A